jgi:hypothetical protein
MWSRLDDEFFDHPKVSVAGKEVGGKNGRVVVIGFYAMSLMWSNKHLTDGVLPRAVIESFKSHVANPLLVADALVRGGLFDKADGGAFRIHDYRDFNPSAAEVKRKRRADRQRKARANGHA